MSEQAATADEALMRAYAGGDTRAFETLYDRHATRVWRYIFRGTRDNATADELAQDVWLRVARAAPGYAPSAATAQRPVARFTTWLLTLAHHRVVDHLRQQRPTQSLDEPLHDERTLADTLAAPSGFGPLRGLLAALDALPPEQRHSFLLQAEGGMSVAEIADATGVGLETAKSRLRYARTALRRALEDIA
jgi:RNA polymerase sigma factor (sigma-70 family)